MTDPLDPLRAHFSGLWLREDGPYGQVYGGRDFADAEVTVAVLSVAAAGDPRLRDAFADVVWRHSVGKEPGRATVYGADLHAVRPWAATRNAPSEPGAEQLFAGLSEAASAGLLSPATVFPSAVPPPTPVPPPTAPPGGFPSPTVPPAGYPPPTGAGRPVQLPVVLGAGGAVLAVLVLVAVGVVISLQWGAGDDAPLADGTGGPTAAPALSSVEPTPIGGVDHSSGGKPTLRAVEPVSVLGPTFARTDDTFTMAFEGWPFAFRTQRPWNCFGADWEVVPESLVWACIGESGSEQRVSVVLWECPTDCSDEEQGEMLDTWLDEAERAIRAPTGPTYYVETERDGVYSVDLGHFAADPATGDLRWLVGVYAEAPSETRGDVLKILNDIVSQAG